MATRYKLKSPLTPGLIQDRNGRLFYNRSLLSGKKAPAKKAPAKKAPAKKAPAKKARTH